jgi:PAS domain-containing protein
MPKTFMRVDPRERANLVRLAQVTSELDRSEAATENREHLLQGVIDHAPHGIVVCDRLGHFIMWNKQAVRIVGRGALEVTPDKWADVYDCRHPETRRRLPVDELPLVRALRGEYVYNSRLWLGSADNGKLVVCHATPIQASGEEMAGAVVMFMEEAQSA